MIIRHPARTSWSRRDVLRGSAAALMGAYGLAPRYGLAADIPMEYDGRMEPTRVDPDQLSLIAR